MEQEDTHEVQHEVVQKAQEVLKDVEMSIIPETQMLNRDMFQNRIQRLE